MPVWWNGRHGGLKILWCLHRAGSSPATGTTSEQALYRLLRLFCKSQSALMPLLLLSAKSHARLPCSVVNALATVRCRYQLFAGSSPHQNFAAASCVLPLATSEQAMYRLLRFFYKNQSALMPLLLLSAKSHARLTCSVVNALATVRCRYQLFAGLNPHQHFMLASFLLPVDKMPECFSVRAFYFFIIYKNFPRRLRCLRRRGFVFAS